MLLLPVLELLSGWLCCVCAGSGSLGVIADSRRKGARTKTVIARALSGDSTASISNVLGRRDRDLRSDLSGEEGAEKQHCCADELCGREAFVKDPGRKH